MISVAEWKPADNLTLEPNAQKAATEQIHSLALTAGPGAGKTEMLAQRADFLLRSGTCTYPKRILAISFKVDASQNLRERVKKRCGYDLASRFDSYTFHAFAKRIIDRFRPVLEGNDALDVGFTIGDQKVPRKQITFVDLVPLAIQILKTSSIARNAVRQTYSDVFLDEFQDCTHQQYELVKLAFHNTPVRLTAVGDVKQKIMGWAGALEGIFLTFAQDFSAMPLNLYRNFRSVPGLLRVQNEIIKVIDPDSVMPDEQLEGDAGEILSTQFANSSDEASYLADTIKSWIETEELAPSEIAILVSKQLDLYAHDLIKALTARGIPFRNEQEMQDITVEPAARLIVDYLSCLYGKREPKAWIRLMKQLQPFADDDVQSEVSRSLDSFIRKQRKAMAGQTAEQRSTEWWEPAKLFLQHVGIETVAALSPEYESKARLRDVITDTKNRISELSQSTSTLEEALDRFSDDESVRILTIHKSKGLEFDSVIMMAIENEIFFGNQDENRCAFFVGVSRAKRRLVLTNAKLRPRPENHGGMWREHRSPQSEYLSYVEPFLTEH
ncbi:ATP-dependent helicase [Marinobacter adhaerens]|jgi:superfamily I DNA/RNA helicase|uniref:DNA 3'-5' helicase n=2 Tax=Marinobacter adhaerens TaxID=1033846 RepID=A0ABX8IQ83_9GAMM|nr:ATP-dependent helicase [Marinobacter adhaerens]ADP96958.1 DNA helicase [Marinobacter adhaerens HP15]MBW4980470.1 ATP-dependent helicase [Marinobacter adhaerens]QWV14904.1 ATP-dependent helicase [Marinobacter adhaerens]